jgi:hypothetical protein
MWAATTEHCLALTTDLQLLGGFHRLVISDDSHLSRGSSMGGGAEEDDTFGQGGGSVRADLLTSLRQGAISEAGKRKLLGYTPILVHAGVLEEGTGLQSEIRNVTVMFLLIDTTDIAVREPASPHPS